MAKYYLVVIVYWQMCFEYYCAEMISRSFLILGLVIHICEPNSMSDYISPTKAEFRCGMLIFEDNFETFDSDKWIHEESNQAHINEFQLYTDSKENSYVEDGVLHIKPTFYNESEVTDRMNDYMKNTTYLKDKFHPIRSARICTKESFSFAYGVVEIKARIPSGDWLFPALWLMPRDSDYGWWPVSGEIDVMEARGNRNLTDATGNLVGAQMVSSTLHWAPNKDLNRWRMTHFTKESYDSYSSDFHTFKLVWTPDSISFQVDGEEIGAVTPPDGGYWKMGDFPDDIDNPWKNGTKSAPFDRQFHLIINLAVGGTAFFSDTYTNEGGKPWNNSSPDAALEFWENRDQWLPTWNLHSDDSHFLIDYVRVWAS